MIAPAYTDEMVTLYRGDCIELMGQLPAESIDSIVTDPPYGLGFMGKAWDELPPGREWAEACLRVLKPGGYLLAFGGTRTWHRLQCAVEDAGFEIRDSIAWLYGNGFPKSRNVTEAMESYLEGAPLPERDGTPLRPGLFEVTAFLRAARDAAGWTNKRIDALFGTNGMAGHWTTAGTQPAVPSPRQWEVLRDALGFGPEMDELAAELASQERPEDWGTGEGDSGRFLDSLGLDDNAPPARGWGTALKPAFEPVVVARKPTRGTTTSNVRQFGTGALNIDGCRIEMNEDDRAKYVAGQEAWRRHGEVHSADGSSKANAVYGKYGLDSSGPNDLGRWPTNVVIDEQVADALGEVARYFPTFRYEPKAPSHERPIGEDGRGHPTVKPLGYMRWLCKLVTPPHGLVLEPFLGSGTTAEACVIEGLRCIGFERDPASLDLSIRRLAKPIQPDLFGASA